MSYLMPPLLREQSRRRTEKNTIRAFVENCTVEKMAEMMQKSPRGLLMIRDEIAALFSGFNQYKAKGAGSDRQFYLSCASGSRSRVDRKDPTAEPVFINHPRLSLVGGIQPKILVRYTCDADDGLFDRFLFSYPDPLPMAGETGLTVPRELRVAWADAVDRMWGVDMVDSEFGKRPYYLKPTPAAWDVWVEWTHWLAGCVNGPEFPEDLKGPAAKLRGYAPRLALVCHSLRGAYSQYTPERVISADDMAAGVTLAKYFLSHARRVWMASGRDERVPPARRILEWVKNWEQPQSTFTRRDLWRGLRRQFPTIEDMARPLRWLVSMGYLRYVGEPSKLDARGTRTTRYEIHPSLIPEHGDMGDNGDNGAGSTARQKDST